jgi:hypothetical protein
MAKLATAVPLGMYRTSGSRVRLPRRITLLKLFMTLLPGHPLRGNGSGVRTNGDR